MVFYHVREAEVETILLARFQTSYKDRMIKKLKPSASHEELKKGLYFSFCEFPKENLAHLAFFEMLLVILISKKIHPMQLSTFLCYSSEVFSPSDFTIEFFLKTFIRRRKENFKEFKRHYPFSLKTLRQ